MTYDICLRCHQVTDEWVEGCIDHECAAEILCDERGVPSAKYQVPPPLLKHGSLVSVQDTCAAVSVEPIAPLGAPVIAENVASPIVAMVAKAAADQRRALAPARPSAMLVTA